VAVERLPADDTCVEALLQLGKAAEHKK